jgi:catechol 2,3-dioxygenase-like lactoylglutathione lyase family enzyme
MPRIRHLAIVSPNRERLVNFYTTAFEMRVVYGRPTSTHLSDGDFNLAILDQEPDLQPDSSIKSLICSRTLRPRF